MIQPRNWSTLMVVWACSLACSRVSALISQWSKYTCSFTPCCLNSATMGRSSLVNSRGEVINPKGRQVNWYTFLLTMKHRYLWTAWCIGTWSRHRVCLSIPSTPDSTSDGWTDGPLRLHLEVWNYHVAVESGEIDPVFFGTRNSRL